MNTIIRGYHIIINDKIGGYFTDIVVHKLFFKSLQVINFTFKMELNFLSFFSLSKERNHLVFFTDDGRMETLFLRCKGSIEKCKQTIDMYYTLRSALPELLCNRDPSASWFKQMTSTG
jgi:hypothetical protein